MKYRLGLDLGTNSIGWAVLALDEHNVVTDLTDMGVRIFSDGREPKTGEPLAVARRTARSIRRNLQRRKLRRRGLFRFLQRNGLFPATSAEAADLKTLDPYALRVKALDEKLAPFELGRTLFHLGVRRGFKSNRKDNPDEKLNADDTVTAETLQEKDLNKLKQGEKIVLFQAELEKSGARTLGEFLSKNHSFRFSPEKTRYYPLRQMYEVEFAAIRKTQEKFYPDVAWDKIHEAIFFQRPLRPQERGKCQFMPDKERTFKVMPCSQQFRILQDVLNLTYTDETQQKTIELREDQQDVLVVALNATKEMSFESMRRLLRVSGTFNLESLNRDKLKGNAIACDFRKDKYFGEAVWNSMSLVEQDTVVEALITANEDSDVLPLLDKYPLSMEQKKVILAYPIPSGTTSFCKEVTEALVVKMQETRLQYDKAADALGYKHSDQSVEEADVLPYYGKVLTGSTMGAGRSGDENQPELKYGKIANPTVHVALNQTRVVVNALIKKYGKPAQFPWKCPVT